LSGIFNYFRTGGKGDQESGDYEKRKRKKRFTGQVNERDLGQGLFDTGSHQGQDDGKAANGWY